jgi:predicted PurR-regulated permease PerM
MPQQAATHPRSRLLNTFAGVALGVLVVATLYLASSFLIPVALAVFLSFLMTPIVDRLERWVGRAVAVVATGLAAAGLLVGIGWAVTHEFSGLVQRLGRPDYARNIGEKVEFVERWFRGGIVREVQNLTRKVEENIRPRKMESEQPPENKPEEQPKNLPDEQQTGTKPQTPPPPPTVSTAVTTADEPGWLSGLPASLGRAGELLAQSALVAVLVMFMLIRREDLRNRVIRLIGHGRLTVTTMALDDATARVSRYLLVQLLINGCYGLLFAAGLWLIGVPYAFLWGFLAAVMRYVPYIGIWLAVVPPILLSLAASPGWTKPLWVLGLVAALELVTANVIEPVLFGQSIGVSEVALLVSAAFWAWLWGPIGLVLSAPLTVCLVVLGRYVPQLEFFDVLLGDAPPLPARLVFYQRLLARDQDEAAAVIENHTRTSPPEQVYDEFLVPALVAAKRDRDHRNLSEPDERFIVGAVAETADQLAAGDFGPTPPPAAATPAGPRPLVLGCPARDEADELALRMFRGLLDPSKWEFTILPVTALAAELIDRVSETRPAAVVIASLPPGGLAHTRYLCKRLRQRHPDLKVTVGLWGLTGDVAKACDGLAEAGADQVATTMLETQHRLAEWQPVFAAAAEPPADRPMAKDRVEEAVV